LKKKNKLTLKQKRFADEYIISGNAYRSAIEAGYSKSYAKGNVVKLLENVSVKAYIDKRLEEINSEKIADQTEVLQYLTSVMRGTSQSAVVVIEGDGDGVSSARLMDKTPDEKEKLKAAELLGKRYGAFTEKVDISGDMSLSIEVDYGTEDTSTEQ
jgi:phage terminase small subunit